MDFIGFLGAFGLGAVVSAFVQHYLNLRSQKLQRQFNERKEAFIGLLNANKLSAIEQTDAAAKEFAYWQMRCELVGSKRVRSAIKAIIDSKPDSVNRGNALEELQNAMRNDLGV